MLPDLRIVIAAVLSTFVLTVGVGFYASSRLIHDQMAARLDGRGDDIPVSRIALNWPEPVSVERPLDLDFAIRAQASKNPVREVAPDEAWHAASSAATPPAEVVAQQETPETAAHEPVTPAVPAQETAAQETARQETAPQEATPAAPSGPARPVDDIAASPESAAPVAAAQDAPAPDSAATDAPAIADAPAAAEAAVAEMPAPPASAHIVVHPDQPVPAGEATGSIAAAPGDAPSQPAVGTAAEGDSAQQAATQAKAQPKVRKKRARRIVKRPPPRVQPVPQTKPFDFFGLFRALSSQTQTQTQTPPAL